MTACCLHTFILWKPIPSTQTHAASCSDGDLKLVGGVSEAEGRLEVCFNKRWGTIHGDGWTQTETQVACKQLGHPTSSISSFPLVFSNSTLLSLFFCRGFLQ